MNLDELQRTPQSLGPLGPGARSVGGSKPSVGPRFAEVLQAQAQALDVPPLKLSAHAANRLESRNIKLSAADWDRIVAGVDKAAAKGAREALVLHDQAALVVSVRNRTVITAVDPAGMKDNVFTNIDTAVIV